MDPNGNPYANGTVVAVTIVATGQKSVSTSPIALNAIGFFSTILPTATYTFSLCGTPVNLGPQVKPPPQQVCFLTLPIAVSGGSLDISSVANPLAALLGPALNQNAGAAAHSIAINEGPNEPISGLLLGLNQIPVGTASGDPIAESLSSLGVTVNGQVIPPGGSGNVNVGAAVNSFALNQGNGNPLTGFSLGAGQVGLGTAGAPTAANVSTCPANQATAFNGSAFPCVPLGVVVNGQTVNPGTPGNVNVGAAAHSIALNQGNGNAMTGLLLGLNQFAAGQSSADPIVSTIPTCTAGTHLFFGGTLPLTCTPDTISPAVQSNVIAILGSPVDISGNTNVAVKAQSVTMPSSGCPCRAFVSYGAFIDFTNAGQAAMFVSDGTNSFATAESLVTGSASNFGVSGSSFSTGTYANSASITFTLFGNSNAGGTSTVLTANGPGAGQNTWLNVAIFTSN